MLKKDWEERPCSKSQVGTGKCGRSLKEKPWECCLQNNFIWLDQPAFLHSPGLLRDGTTHSRVGSPAATSNQETAPSDMPTGPSHGGGSLFPDVSGWQSRWVSTAWFMFYVLSARLHVCSPWWLHLLMNCPVTNCHRKPDFSPQLIFPLFKSLRQIVSTHLEHTAYLPLHNFQADVMKPG